MRIRDGNVGYYEIIALVVVSIITKIFVFQPAHMVKDSLNAGWIVMLIDTIIALILFLPLADLARKYPEQSFVQVGEKLVGRFFGFFIVLLLILFFFSSAIVTLRGTIEFIKTTVLPITPISVLLVLYVLTIIYAAYQGLESLSRGMWLFTPFILFAILFITIGVYPFMNATNVFPVLGLGIPKILNSSLTKVATFSEMIVLIVIYPYIRENGKFKKVGVISIIFSGLILSGIVLATVITFSTEFAEKEIFPMFRMARLIFYGRFLERVDPLFISIWVFCTLFMITTMLYATSVTLAEYLKLPTYKPLVFPLGLLLFTVSLIPQKIEIIEHLDFDILHKYGGIVLLIPAILLFVNWIRHRSKPEPTK